MKPRIRRGRHALAKLVNVRYWVCEIPGTMGGAGFGFTVVEAYNNWARSRIPMLWVGGP